MKCPNCNFEITKQCRKCREVKPASQFLNSTGDDLACWCIDCDYLSIKDGYPWDGHKNKEALLKGLLDFEKKYGHRLNQKGTPNDNPNR